MPIFVKCTMHLDRHPDDFVSKLIHPVYSLRPRRSQR